MLYNHNEMLSKRNHNVPRLCLSLVCHVWLLNDFTTWQTKPSHLKTSLDEWFTARAAAAKVKHNAAPGFSSWYSLLSRRPQAGTSLDYVQAILRLRRSTEFVHENSKPATRFPSNPCAGRLISVEEKTRRTVVVLLSHSPLHGSRVPTARHL